MGLFLALVLAGTQSTSLAGIVNGGFSTPTNTQSIQHHAPALVTGWATTDRQIEIWKSGTSYGGVTFQTPPGYTQFAEVNAHTDGTLSQIVRDIKMNSTFGFSFYHRGRGSASVPDVIKVKVVDTVTNQTLLDRNFSTTNVEWKRYTVPIGVKKDANPLLLSFTAVSSGANDKSIGNFLTGVELGEEFAAPPRPVQTSNVKMNAHGDVHISTNDQVYFDYHGVGDFYGVRSADGTFDLVARQESWVTNPKVTINTAVALRFGKANTTVVFHALPAARMLVNGAVTPIPRQETALPSGVSLTPAQGGIIAEYDGRRVLVIVRNGFIDYGIGQDLSFKYRGGLIGNLDDNSANDMTLPNGKVLSIPADQNGIAQFGEAWRVPANEKYFNEPHPAAPKPTEVSEVDPAKAQEGRKICQDAGINDPLALKDCAFDVSRTGNRAFVASAQQFQAEVKAIPAAKRVGGDVRTAQAIARGADVEPPPAVAGGGGGGGTLFLPGEQLQRGSRYQMNGHFATFQTDGNFCVYTSTNTFVWCVNGLGVRYQDAARVVFTNEGILTMFNANNQPLWRQPERGANPASKVQITNQGALQIVGPGNAVLWSSK